MMDNTIKNINSLLNFYSCPGSFKLRFQRFSLFFGYLLPDDLWTSFNELLCRYEVEVWHNSLDLFDKFYFLCVVVFDKFNIELCLLYNSNFFDFLFYCSSLSSD